MAVEPWTDPRLPAKDDLALWLDAAKVKEGRAALGAHELDLNLRRVDLWPDGSGQGHHVRQPAKESQPALVTSPGGSTLRFDGKASFLLGAWAAKLDTASVFIVAAPRTNGGGFRGLVAMHPEGKNDYVGGLNVDLGSAAQSTMDMINVEGAGARGQTNLLRTRFDMGTFHVFALEVGTDKISLRVDGKDEASRSRSPSALELAEFLVGARCYDNSGASPRPQGFFDGDIAEVIVYHRALTGDERSQVERYLLNKYGAMRKQSLLASAPGSKPLQTVENPALVQFLMPGFEARQLPVDLTNINFLKYRHDGVLVAGAYNGKIWLLRDTDGDGLEDQATLYYESPNIKSVMGLAVTPKGDPRGDGVFVATVGHVYFIPEKDGHGEKEIEVAGGWETARMVTAGVSDCLGLALDRQGGVWFGLGTSDYAHAYLPDPKTGVMTYHLPTERGTIQHVSPDFKKRETVCTGIRFPVGMAFNSRGDLFCTDQEGATWLPNGNPLDELLYIKPGRHYGFPPRHPKYLPDVIDEPSVYDFAPQHQSTCGFFFNDSTGPIFGPEGWRGDAFVCGESRGKLWRVKLAKTDAGYIAQTQLLAHLRMLPIDAALAPNGDLVVTCHSGSPDWGSGPNGKGKIFHIRQANAALPKPVRTWSASPTKTIVQWDRPLSEQQFRDITKSIDMTAGQYVRAGDRFESLRPGYQAVSDQLAAPRIDVPVQYGSLSDDRCSIIVHTPPRSSGTHYAIQLGGYGSDQPNSLAGAPAPASTPLPQQKSVDVEVTLNGVEASFQPAAGPLWHGWLPHPDPAVAREFTRGSGEHDPLFTGLTQAGKLTLRGQLDLYEMLQPTIQPGAKLDYERPPETVNVRVEASAPFTIASGPAAARDAEQEDTRYVAHLQFAGPGQQWQPFELHVDKPAGDLVLNMTWSTADDPRPRAFPLRRFYVPYANREAPTIVVDEERHIPELAGGNWLRGKNLFYSKATCSLCHTIHGAGGKVGPELSNLRFRDYASVLRDIREPSATINPDFAAYTVQTADGSAIVGVFNGEKNGVLRFTDTAGQVHEVPRAKVKTMQALPVSLMPEKLLDALTPGEQRDLLTFLLQTPFEPAPVVIDGVPAPRKRAEVERILGPALTAPPDPAAKPLRIVLCASEKDAAHGKPGYHDYPLWRSRWTRLLNMAEGVTAEPATDWPSEEQWAKADLVVFDSYNPVWALERDDVKISALGEQIDKFLARGGGLVSLHWSLNGGSHPDALAQRLGLAWGSPASKYRHGASDWVLDKNHPLAAGFGEFQIPDESYWHLTGDLAAANASVLASSVEEGLPTPQMWTRQVGAGRVFVSIPGHFRWTYDDPLYRILIFRGMMWSARQPIDRLAPLVMVGARVEE
ncbi:MAG TPA: ThuA domain-containing protein [Chthoniobacter sp.]|jgi:putative heme-binding domain-containing protein